MLFSLHLHIHLSFLSKRAILGLKNAAMRPDVIPPVSLIFINCIRTAARREFNLETLCAEPQIVTGTVYNMIHSHSHFTYLPGLSFPLLLRTI